MLVVHWPPAWRKFYLESGFVGRDPILEALAKRKPPFTWSDLRADRSISALGTQALREVAAHGWTEGLVVPIPRSVDRIGLVSLAGQRGSFDDEEIRFLSTLSFVFHERVRLLAPKCGVAVPPQGLTAREAEALLCVASGDDDARIATRMGVGKPTAHEFVEKAKRKLKASNRSQAVALAVSMGLISP
jgi:DNA-binding CsgD family transcriptional regulator